MKKTYFYPFVALCFVVVLFAVFGIAADNSYNWVRPVTLINASINVTQDDLKPFLRDSTDAHLDFLLADDLMVNRTIGDILTQDDIDNLPIFTIPITWHEYAVVIDIPKQYFIWGVRFPTIVRIENTSLYNVTWYRWGHYVYFHDFTECLYLYGVGGCVDYTHNEVNVSTQELILYERIKIAMWKTNPPWHAFNWSSLSIEGNNITVIWE